MTRFNVGGDYLDLESGFSVTFTQDNMLFAFDDLKCSRTAEFSIKGTTNNNAIFGFANNPNTNGYMVRVSIPATLEDGLVTMEGNIHVSSYDVSKNEYHCVFVYGGLLGVLEAAQAGKLKDYLTHDDLPNTAIYNRTPSVISGQLQWGTQGYYNHADMLQRDVFPSMGVKYILDAVCSHFPITVTLPTGFEHLTLTPDKLVNTYGDDAEIGDTVRLIDNLPDVTVGDILRAIQAVSGTHIMVANNSITFETISVQTAENWDCVELDKSLISIGIERVFKDFARDTFIVNTNEAYGTPNIIDYSADYFPTSKYHVENEFLEKSTNVYELPFDLGVGQEMDNRIVFANEMGGFGLGIRRASNSINSLGGGADTNELTVSGIIQRLCATSTQIEVECRMSALEYMSIKPDTLIYVRGMNCVWINSQHSNGRAKFSLAVI